MQSYWRQQTYKKISLVTMSGNVIDLGGSKHAEYHALIKGSRKIVSVNIDEENGYDFSFTLEEKFPLASHSYNGALCINVLEHIFNYEQLLHETYRILKPESELIIAVPFLIQYHPCPSDYWRYSRQTLERILGTVGFKEIIIEEIGCGPCIAAASLLHNALKFKIVRIISLWLAQIGDWIVVKLGGSAYSAHYYPLGYFVTAKK